MLPWLRGDNVVAYKGLRRVLMEWLRTIAISTGVMAVISLSTFPTFFGTGLVSGVTIVNNLLFSPQASTAVTTPASDLRYDAWVYPDAPGALDQIRRIGHIHAIK